MNNSGLSEFASQLVTPTAIQQYGQLCAGQLDSVVPSQSTRQQLESMTLESVVGPCRNQLAGECCLSGVWLLHGELDASHDISQRIKTSDGSYWHGIMHRLERDFWNSKYWYQNVGNHPVLDRLQEEFGEFYPNDFVDQCEALLESENPSPADVERVENISTLEWKFLFEHCLQTATN